MGISLLVHVVAIGLFGGGLVGVWAANLRARQARKLEGFSQAVGQMRVFYDRGVIPGASLLGLSGIWMIIHAYPGATFLRTPWLAGMALLFVFLVIEGNTVTRGHFVRLRRFTKEAEALGEFTPELRATCAEGIPTFTHFLDLPIVFVIVALGTLQPNNWSLFLLGTTLAVLCATGLMVAISKLYPWSCRQ